MDFRGPLCDAEPNLSSSYSQYNWPPPSSYGDSEAVQLLVSSENTSISFHPSTQPVPLFDDRRFLPKSPNPVKPLDISPQLFDDNRCLPMSLDPDEPLDVSPQQFDGNRCLPMSLNPDEPLDVSPQLFDDNRHLPMSLDPDEPLDVSPQQLPLFDGNRCLLMSLDPVEPSHVSPRPVPLFDNNVKSPDPVEPLRPLHLIETPPSSNDCPLPLFRCLFEPPPPIAVPEPSFPISPPHQDPLLDNIRNSLDDIKRNLYHTVTQLRKICGKSVYFIHASGRF